MIQKLLQKLIFGRPESYFTNFSMEKDLLDMECLKTKFTTME